jgi:Phage capsid family
LKGLPMPTREATKMRMRELRDEVERKTADYEAGRISDKNYYRKFINKALEESNELEAELKAYEQANKFAGGTEVATGGVIPGMQTTKAFASVPQNPINLTPAQAHTLEMAAKARMPITMEVGVPGGIEERFASGVITKSPVLESGIGGGFTGNLPPVQSPYAVGIGYEPTRVASWLAAAAMPGPSATWITHTANASEVTGIGEATAAADISPTVIEAQAKPQKLMGVVSTSLEAWYDTEAFGEGALGSWLQVELQRSLVNTASNYIIGANSSGYPSGSAFNGLLATSGTLTRSVGTDTPLDSIAKAIVDVRVGAAFAEPDLMLMHPNTYGALLRSKDANGRYLVDLVSGPRGFTADGSSQAQPADAVNPYSITPQGNGTAHGHLFGVGVVLTTQLTAGTAIVISIRNGGAIFWTRQGVLLEFDPYSGAAGTNFSTAAYTWRAIERVSLSVPRPAAVNILTGLPTS